MNFNPKKLGEWNQLVAIVVMVPSLIIRVPSFSHIKRWNRRTHLSPFSLSSMSCLFSLSSSLSLSLCSISVLSSPHHITLPFSHTHPIIIIIIIVLNMPSPLTLLLPFCLNAAVSFTSTCCWLFILPTLTFPTSSPLPSPIWVCSTFSILRKRFIFYYCLHCSFLCSLLHFSMHSLFFLFWKGLIILLLNKPNRARAWFKLLYDMNLMDKKLLTAGYILLDTSFYKKWISVGCFPIVFWNSWFRSWYILHTFFFFYYSYCHPLSVSMCNTIAGGLTLTECFFFSCGFFKLISLKLVPALLRANVKLQSMIIHLITWVF